MLQAMAGRRVLLLCMALILLGASQPGAVAADLHSSLRAGPDGGTWHVAANNSDISDIGSEAGPPVQDLPPAYMEVVGQFDQRDDAPDLASGYALQETITVPVDGSSVASTTILGAGMLYEIKASGTFFVGGAGDMLGKCKRSRDHHAQRQTDRGSAECRG